MSLLLAHSVGGGLSRAWNAIVVPLLPIRFAALTLDDSIQPKGSTVLAKGAPLFAFTREGPQVRSL